MDLLTWVCLYCFVDVRRLQWKKEEEHDKMSVEDIG